MTAPIVLTPTAAEALAGLAHPEQAVPLLQFIAAAIALADAVEQGRSLNAPLARFRTAAEGVVRP